MLLLTAVTLQAGWCFPVDAGRGVLQVTLWSHNEKPLEQLINLTAVFLDSGMRLVFSEKTHMEMERTQQEFEAAFSTFQHSLYN